jgi:hypothetical protein
MDSRAGSLNLKTALSVLSCDLQVEKYFGSLLPSTQYWHGASRAALGSDYTLTDGMPIMQASPVAAVAGLLLLGTWSAFAWQLAPICAGRQLQRMHI